MPNPAFRNYHVSEQLAGSRLSAALRRWRPEDSWSRVRRLVQHRHVQVNGNLCTDEARSLKTGDVVKVWHEPVAGPVRADDVRIVHLDAHLIVVDKPAGVTTLRHSEERHWSEQRRQFQPTLDEMLRQILTRRAKHGRPTDRGRRPEPPSLRAVHRLDRDTSGLMVFARTAEAERRLVQMFRKHDLHRAYLAIVHGRLEAQTIESYLIRDRGDGLRGSTRQADEGQRAVTHVRPVENLAGYTLIECRLETGRTHQIRIHLAEAGHMVCGEKVYVRPLHGTPTPDRSGAPRQALHAAELSFMHPVTGQKLEFRTPLPDDISHLLERLRKLPRHIIKEGRAKPFMTVPRPSASHGYSLSALFLLITAAGVLLAMAAPMLRDQREAGAEELLGASIAGGVVLSLVGFVLGLFHYHRWRSVLWGVPLGGVLGLLIGPLIFLSPASLPFVFLNSLGGAAVIVGVGAVARLTSVPQPAAGNPFQETRNGAAFMQRHWDNDHHGAEPPP